ncbi:hypothetical protein [Acidocella aminolytica]|uniref:Uncharacterized protein n=1 Tax=Acidocella aminolytica 101 = DSM 11237 TaxID=1120923 RepID=A0A0D6PEL9_9PROT|nr:hypothetical protein [Acidocella aminolytica]GAN79801.1 hypothetical protein Aam_030_034 [Acidocella aminolytica 101 = DSM 11237]GBQ34300.1 hypothetical protein AA11237_0707 [Acidocella aminolytica 101 = DSM 11237]SHF35367.1 hypothetical protein SAMN02746095_02932 [Acidocella aminolytica 101 = DSM 11237]
MAAKFFKATIGDVTFFRKSASRDYKFGTVMLGEDRNPCLIGFSNTGRAAAGWQVAPAVEITEQEFKVLNNLKTERLEALWNAHEAQGLQVWRTAQARDSWVRS